VLKQMGINCLCMDNVEADDLIATLAATFSQTSTVTIYSADKVCSTVVTISVSYPLDVSRGMSRDELG
jgi:5'-3' exonuclease